MQTSDDELDSFLFLRGSDSSSPRNDCPFQIPQFDMAMATLTRTNQSSRQTAQPPPLTSSIPSPFPIAEVQHLLREQDPQPEPNVQQFAENKQNLSVAQRDSLDSENSTETAHELLPSIASVRRSCIMTLNNLLSAPTNWSPIVPDRRHSAPSINNLPATDAELSSAAALQTLLTNLRNADSCGTMVEISPATSESDLLDELRTRVECISDVLDPNDAELALTIISLLAHFDRLVVLESATSPPAGSFDASTTRNQNENPGAGDLFDTLKKQLSDLQVQRSSRPGSSTDPPVVVVEKALLWSRIDEGLEKVVSMCKERTEIHPRFSDQLPPQYDLADYLSDEALPEYQPAPRSSLNNYDSKRASLSSSGAIALNEKTRLDLEAVTMAIDRLYLVAPQLHNQRAELRSAKQQQFDNTGRTRGQTMSGTIQRPWSTGKRKESDIRELDSLVDLLAKAHDRKLLDQSVVLEGGIDARLENMRLRDIKKRDAFVEQLIHHSEAGRLHSQDAVLPATPRIKDPDALLTLPEFLRQSVPDSVRLANPSALLTLNEFVKESAAANGLQRPTTPLEKPKKNRNRSISAPPISWLKSSSSKASSSRQLQSHTAQCSDSESLGFDVSYVAENHENLQHVLVFLTVTGADPTAEMEVEVLPSSPDSDQGDRLLIRNGRHTSFPLILPVPTSAGKKEMKAQGSNYEIKLFTSPFTPITSPEPLPLLDASQLTSSNPTGFNCSSCSLPVVRLANNVTYRDLPSEHWEELVDAWMCHADQRLHERVIKRSRGFWPEPSRALVGGSYLLFEESSMVSSNICSPDETKRGEDWIRVRCICGAILGRYQEHGQEMHARVYRLVKYAIRQTGTTVKPQKVPLSAFIVEDMNEFVQAHATYRFVVFDEEEERPRILIWLFKPSIRLAYTTPTQYTFPRSGSIHAAKVLYSIIGPAASQENLESILSKYPGFPQAEYLFYPLTVCRRLASLLKDSTTAYPKSMRTMTGLDVGWLRRA